MAKRGTDGSFWFLVDNERVAFTSEFSTEYDPLGTATIILELRAGQIVRVENQDSPYIVGTESDGARSWFTGFLLYALV